tara:strand:- start:480 stop:818 length:339 start_codon:yes stop_codon:yes gene_type:complete
MVSLVDIYNIKESTFSEIGKDRDPARGNKGKSSERDHYLVHGEPDPETGKVTSTVTYLPSYKRMVADLKAEVQDMKKLSEKNPNDIVLYNLFVDLDKLYNTFRTHVNNKHND